MGLRNSTARSVRYEDVKAELDAGLDVVHMPVQRRMNEVDPNAAKGMVEYPGILGAETVAMIKEYLAWFEKRNRMRLPPQWPLLPGKSLNGKPMKMRTLEDLVKRAARRARTEVEIPRFAVVRAGTECPRRILPANAVP